MWVKIMFVLLLVVYSVLGVTQSIPPLVSTYAVLSAAAQPSLTRPVPLVHESYVLSRLTTHLAGERHWVPINTFHRSLDANDAYSMAITTYGATEVRLERHTVEVLNGPVR